MKKLLLLLFLSIITSLSTAQIDFTVHSISTNIFYNPIGVEAADLDGDGDLDLYAGFADLDQFVWFKNIDGLGTFSDPILVGNSTFYPQSIHAADVDGDGDLDLLTSATYISWYENLDGLGNFGPERVIEHTWIGAGPTQAVDIDGDGDLDVLAIDFYTDLVVWYKNLDGQGNFSQMIIILDTANEVVDVYAADLDGDNDLDVLTANHNKITWMENLDGFGNFGAPNIISTNALAAFSVYAADLDGDGDLDVLSGSALYEKKLSWFENMDGLGTFGPEKILMQNESINDINASDFDNDGDIDVVATWYYYPSPDIYGGIVWFENLDGLGTFSEAKTIIDSNSVISSVFTADIDADGDIDLTSSQLTHGKIIWCENTISSNICDVVGPSNGFEGGIECSFGSLAGNDLTVPAGSSILLESITLNLWLPLPQIVQEVYVEIDDPSSPYYYYFWGTFAPTSQTAIGTSGDYTIYSVLIDIPDTYLPGRADEPHPYWIFINTPAINGEMVLWEYSTTEMIGTYGVGQQIFFDPLIIDNSKEGVYTFNAMCLDNDEPFGALMVNCDETIIGSTELSNVDTAPFCNISLTSPGVWYSFTDSNPLPSSITVSTCGPLTNFDTKLSIYSGDPNNLICVGSNDNDVTCSNNQSKVEFITDGVPNTTYYILVHGYASQTGSFELSVSCEVLPPPNDEIQNAINLNEIGCPFTDENVAMSAATEDDGSPSGCDIDGKSGVWYVYTPSQDGQIIGQIVTPSGEIQQVSFFQAPHENATIDDLVYLDYPTNNCGQSIAALIPTFAGITYYCFVVNSGGATDITFYDCVLEISNNNLNGFVFYPNPTKELLKLSANHEIEQVILYNLLGQKLSELHPKTKVTELSLSNLSNGTYLMDVTINGHRGIYSVIKN